MKMEKGEKEKQGNEMRDNRRNDGKEVLLHISPKGKRKTLGQSFHHNIEMCFLGKQTKNGC
jgi:hypothetical protein